jgi:hypothetical protein
MAFIAWANDFHDLDAAALARLSPEMRALQVQARRALWLYADAMWDAAKDAGLSPANTPECNCIAALRDQGMELYATAQEAQGNAGEDEEDLDPHPELPPIDTW